MPIVTMSVWPSTSTIIWRRTVSRTRSWTASTWPAWTDVRPYGARIEWNTARLTSGGARSVSCLTARKAAWSAGVQSVSRFCMKLAMAGKLWLLTLVSMWKQRTVSSISCPCRMQEACSAESGGCM